MIFRQLLALSTLLLCLTACGANGAYLRQAIDSSTQVQDIELDGERFRLVSYSTGRASGTAYHNTIFFIGGSGCTSLRVYLAPYLASYPSGVRIVGLEKAGAEENSIGRSCSQEFWQAYRYDEMLRRNRLALAWVERDLGAPIAGILGVSEGGPIALEMAAANPDIPRVAVLGAGGMSQREELQMLYDQRGNRAQLDAVLGRIDDDPDNGEAWALGYPHTYWSAVLDRSPDAYLGAVRQPVLLVIGEQDENVPAASARRAADVLSDAELVIWPGANHVFRTPDGDERGQVVARTAEFFGLMSAAGSQ